MMRHTGGTNSTATYCNTTSVIPLFDLRTDVIRSVGGYRLQMLPHNSEKQCRSSFSTTRSVARRNALKSGHIGKSAHCPETNGRPAIGSAAHRHKTDGRVFFVPKVGSRACYPFYVARYHCSMHCFPGNRTAWYRMRLQWR